MLKLSYIEQYQSYSGAYFFVFNESVKSPLTYFAIFVSAFYWKSIGLTGTGYRLVPNKSHVFSIDYLDEFPLKIAKYRLRLKSGNNVPVTFLDSRKILTID